MIVLDKIAEGSLARGFKVFPTGLPLAALGKPELKDPDKFLKDQFPSASVVLSKFDEILFGDLAAAEVPATITDPDGSNKREGKLHTIPVQIPGLKDDRFRELRFVEVKGRLYWVPFGW